jgi:hypothetical protein
MSNILRKREMILFITGLVGGMMIFEYFFAVPAVATASTIVRNWAIIISTFALGLGILNAVRLHSGHIMKRTKGQWIFSVWLLVYFVILTVIGLWNTKFIVYDWSFKYVYTSLSSTFYALTGFYIFSAAYRAFRARNIEATILIVSGVLILLRNAPIGEAIWTGFPILGEWVLMVGQLGGMRTLTFVAGAGLIVFGIRTLLGLERGYYGGGE